MAVPKKRTTKSTKGQRRSHLAVTVQTLSACPNCGKPVFSHNLCASCGNYRGKRVVKV